MFINKKNIIQFNSSISILYARHPPAQPRSYSQGAPPPSSWKHAPLASSIRLSLLPTHSALIRMEIITGRHAASRSGHIIPFSLYFAFKEAGILIKSSCAFFTLATSQSKSNTVPFTGMVILMAFPRFPLMFI